MEKSIVSMFSVHKQMLISAQQPFIAIYTDWGCMLKFSLITWRYHLSAWHFLLDIKSTRYSRWVQSDFQTSTRPLSLTLFL